MLCEDGQTAPEGGGGIDDLQCGCPGPWPCCRLPEGRPSSHTGRLVGRTVSAAPRLCLQGRSQCPLLLNTAGLCASSPTAPRGGAAAPGAETGGPARPPTRPPVLRGRSRTG